MNRRNWIVELTDYETEDTFYGPYTQAAAKKAARRIQRWIDRQEDVQMTVNTYPIHQWGRSDET